MTNDSENVSVHAIILMCIHAHVHVHVPITVAHVHVPITVANIYIIFCCLTSPAPAVHPGHSGVDAGRQEEGGLHQDPCSQVVLH